MQSFSVDADHPKKRRRRRLTRSPKSAWIQLSEDLKGEVGRISDDLYTDLFRYASPLTRSTLGASEVRYVAITLWTSRSEDPVADENWSILPVIPEETSNSKVARLPPSTIIFSAASPNLQRFSDNLRTSVVAGNINGKAGFEVLVLDVEPLGLHTVLVEIDGNALDRHYEVQRKFGGGFDTAKINGTTGKGKGKEKVQLRERIGGTTKKSAAETQGETLVTAVRQALQLRLVIRQADLLPIPLPAHPITHVHFPPAKIAFTEPVSQGVLVPSTQVTVKQVFGTVRKGQGLSAPGDLYTARERIVEQEYDTSNDQFFSAVQNKDAHSNQSSLSSEESSESSNSRLDSGDLSEDSSEDVISMSAPRKPINFNSAISSLTAATPRGVHSRLSVINSPGSVYSGFTSSTVRQGSVSGEGPFHAKALLTKISESVLHPKPQRDEDEEARVFVDVKVLLKLGCFSGDWVKINVAAGSSLAQHGSLDDAFGNDEKFANNFRAAKIYGLPDRSPAHMYRNPRHRAPVRPLSSNVFPHQHRSTYSAWFSPILLANLGSPAFVRLSPLVHASSEPGFGPGLAKTRLSSSLSPPIANDITLVKISTPLSTEMALQASLFTALKQHFEAKRRILRKGDIVPLAIDTAIGRMLAQPSSASTTDKEAEERLLMDLSRENRQPKAPEVCWFRVEQVGGPILNEEQSASDGDIWGCWSCVEPTTTFVLHGGTETSKIPSIVDNSWEYYLGVKHTPKYDTAPNTWEIPSRPVPRLHNTSLGHRLRELIYAGISPEAAQHGLAPMFLLLRSTQRYVGKATLILRACADLGVHVFSIDAHNLLAGSGAGGADIKTELLLRAQVERASSCNPETTVILIRHIDALTGDRMTLVLKEVVTITRMLVATTVEVEMLSEDMRSLFTHELEIVAPDETERAGILRTVIGERSIRLSHDVDLAAIATKTAALVAGDLVDVVERAMIARQHRLEGLTKQGSSLQHLSASILIRDILVSGGENACCVTKADFDIAVDAARKNFADSIGAPKIPNVSWGDVGGLEQVKSAVMETIQLPLERPELFAKGMKKRSGILFYGPPGTGKTLLAKAIATEFSLNFFSVKGPELLNMYIGESEANVRRVFQRARDARPCVVFFDELDSVAPKRGNQGDSGGVMDRIVSQLLAELDGMSSSEAGGGGVFVIGATNRPDLLDQALLRPGRFDKMLYLGVSDTHEKQLRILEALTRNFNLRPDVSLGRITESLPFTYTGADLYALCSDAMLKAITRQCTAVDFRIKGLHDSTVTPAYFFDHLATPDDIDVTVQEQDFIDAQRELVGSVRYGDRSVFVCCHLLVAAFMLIISPSSSAKELEHYQHVRRTFEGVDAPKTTSSKYHDAMPTRIPAPIGTLAPPIPNLGPQSKSKVRPAKLKAIVNGKGKGKATVWDSTDDAEDGDDDKEEDEDDAYLTSHDFADEPVHAKPGVNGTNVVRFTRTEGAGSDFRGGIQASNNGE